MTRKKKLGDVFVLKCWIFSFEGWKLFLELGTSFIEGRPRVSTVNS
jgi:hypothetical protein